MGPVRNPQNWPKKGRSLKSLRIYGSKLKTIPTKIFKYQESLVHLMLPNNELENISYKTFQNLKQLKMLTLGKNNGTVYAETEEEKAKSSCGCSAVLGCFLPDYIKDDNSKAPSCYLSTTGEVSEDALIQVDQETNSHIDCEDKVCYIFYNDVFNWTEVNHFCKSKDMQMAKLQTYDDFRKFEQGFRASSISAYWLGDEILLAPLHEAAPSGHSTRPLHLTSPPIRWHLTTPHFNDFAIKLS